MGGAQRMPWAAWGDHHERQPRRGHFGVGSHHPRKGRGPPQWGLFLDMVSFPPLRAVRRDGRKGKLGLRASSHPRWRFTDRYAARVAVSQEVAGTSGRRRSGEWLESFRAAVAVAGAGIMRSDMFDPSPLASDALRRVVSWDLPRRAEAFRLLAPHRVSKVAASHTPQVQCT
jgi:hypothetical protein